MNDHNPSPDTPDEELHAITGQQLREHRDRIADLDRQLQERDKTIADLAAKTEEAVEAEQARWQREIDAEVVKVYPRRDGAGCDSGDPLDLTLTELRQAFAHQADLIADLSAKLVEQDKDIALLRDAITPNNGPLDEMIRVVTRLGGDRDPSLTLTGAVEALTAKLAAVEADNAVLFAFARDVSAEVTAPSANHPAIDAIRRAGKTHLPNFNPDRTDLHPGSALLAGVERFRKALGDIVDGTPVVVGLWPELIGHAQAIARAALAPAPAQQKPTLCACDLRDRQWNPGTGRCETCERKYAPAQQEGK